MAKFFLLVCCTLVSFVPSIISSEITTCKDDSNDYFPNYVETRPRNILEEVTIRLYIGPTVCDLYETKLTNLHTVMSHPHFSKERKTVLYFFGFTEHPLKLSVRFAVKGYLKRNDTNFLVVNWHNIGYFPNFLNVIPGGREVAMTTAAMFKLMFDTKRINLDTFHIIGHSAGAVLGAWTASKLKSYGYLVPRLTHLDPSGYGIFVHGLLNVQISKDDAKFVDAIHTSALIFGSITNVATADFWPNGGINQPGCLLRFKNIYSEFFCAHSRAWRYWAESLENPTAFKASKDDSCLSEKHTIKPCEEKESSPVYMGVDVDTRISGIYYLITNDSPPYGRGEKGACGC